MVSITKDWKIVASRTRNNCVQRLWARVASQDVVANRSVVNVYMDVYCPAGYGYNVASWKASLTGCTGVSGGAVDYEAKTTRYIPKSGYGNITVSHNANGDGSVNVSGTYDASYDAWDWSTGTVTLTLPHINRIGTINGVTASALDAVMSVDYTVNNSSFYHRLKVSADAYTLFYIEDYSSNTEFRLSDYATGSYNSLEWIQRNITAKKNVQLTFTIETWTAKSAATTGNPNVGEAKESITLSLGSAPAIGNYTITETNLSENITVKDMSQKAITASVTAQLYATIKSVTVSAGGATATLSKSGSAYTGHIIGMVTEGDSIDYVLTVTDSRGWTSTQTITQQYFEYSAPSVESCEITRIPNPTGSDPTTPNTPDAIGHVTFRVKYTPILGNRVTVTATGIGTGNAQSDTSGTFEGFINLANADYRRAYKVTVTFVDTLGGRATVKLDLSKSIPTMVEGDTEIDMNVPLFIMGVNATPFADHATRTAYNFEIPGLEYLKSQRITQTGILFGCSTYQPSTGGFMMMVTAASDGSVYFDSIYKKNSITFTGSTSGNTLTINTNASLANGVRLLWLN